MDKEIIVEQKIDLSGLDVQVGDIIEIEFDYEKWLKAELIKKIEYED